jgi:hypothetical protein
MERLQDLGAVYVDISDTEKPLVKSITLDEQGNETQHQLSDSAQLTIEEAMMEYMDLVEKHLKRSMD